MAVYVEVKRTLGFGGISQGSTTFQVPVQGLGFGNALNSLGSLR